MLSIGELIEKIVIENIKIFNIRERLHVETLGDEDYVNLNEKMMQINDNKGELVRLLDLKLDRVLSGSEKNRVINPIKTYD